MPFPSKLALIMEFKHSTQYWWPHHTGRPLGSSHEMQGPVLSGLFSRKRPTRGRTPGKGGWGRLRSSSRCIWACLCSRFRICVRRWSRRRAHRWSVGCKSGGPESGVCACVSAAASMSCCRGWRSGRLGSVGVANVPTKALLTLDCIQPSDADSGGL